VTDRRVKHDDEPSVTSLSLLERARGADPDAWGRLVTLYAPLIYDWCLKAHLQPADAEDIGQKVFEAVFRKLREFRRDRPGDTFRGWLHRITLNKIHDFHRQGAHRPLTGCIHCLPLATPDVGPSNDDQLRENSILLYQALEMVQGKFSDRAWTAFHGVCIQGQAIADVAADMHTTPNAVSLAIGRVITRLRREFFELLPDGLILT
jgi:RNA polymerase sigma-70 factor (ECF subfamily)